MSKKCRAYSESRLGLKPSDNRKAFYAGWDAALRERLAEQPAQQHIEHCIWARNGNTPCPHVQPAQQQQPVVIGRVRLDAGEVHIHPLVRDADKAGLVEGQPVYTSPQPSKPWVGLTEEEIEKLAVESGKATFLNDDEQTDILWFDGDCISLVRAIEAKLREKNAAPCKPLTDDRIWELKTQFEKDAEMKIPEKPFRHVVRAIFDDHGIKGDA